MMMLDPFTVLQQEVEYWRSQCAQWEQEKASLLHEVDNRRGKQYSAEKSMQHAYNELRTLRAQTNTSNVELSKIQANITTLQQQLAQMRTEAVQQATKATLDEKKYQDFYRVFTETSVRHHQEVQHLQGELKKQAQTTAEANAMKKSLGSYLCPECKLRPRTLVFRECNHLVSCSDSKCMERLVPGRKGAPSGRSQVKVHCPLCNTLSSTAVITTS